MAERLHVPNVGAPDPEHNTSPIADEGDDEFEVLKQEVPGEPVCYFNGIQYQNNKFICSGDTLLRCEHGIWRREGTCDPDNP